MGSSTGVAGRGATSGGAQPHWRRAASPSASDREAGVGAERLHRAVRALGVNQEAVLRVPRDVLERSAPAAHVDAVVEGGGPPAVPLARARDEAHPRRDRDVVPPGPRPPTL